MKKKAMVFLVVAILLVVIVAFFAVKALLNDGYAFWGDVWETSPEKALQKAAEQDLNTMQTLTPKIIFEKTTFDDIVLMTFLSQDETLVTVTFASNANDLYSVSGWTEEYDLAHPSEFLMDGNPDQWILFPYRRHDNTVFGWCYSTAQFTVNGISPTRKTFNFDLQGMTYSIDFWTVSGQNSGDHISIEYLS